MSSNPELHYCRCGHTFKFNKWSKILMLLKNKYTYTCPQCGAVMTFKLINHVVKTDTREIKNNKLWRNG